MSTRKRNAAAISDLLSYSCCRVSGQGACGVTWVGGKGWGCHGDHSASLFTREERDQ